MRGLPGANLRKASLDWAFLRDADLRGADLFRASLLRADLVNAKLDGAHLALAKCGEAGLYQVSLRGAWLGAADFDRAILTDADLTEVRAEGVDFRGANLVQAGLYAAHLPNAVFAQANLAWAALSKANLRGASFFLAQPLDTNLSGADLTHVVLDSTAFGNVDLSGVKGLDTVVHRGPSSVGIDTIYRSKGRIPEAFLRGAGVPEDFIRRIPSLLAQPFPFHSCFISYSSKDQDFAERLYEDLQSQGVRCWFAPEDMKIGALIRPAIDGAIHRQEKLLLILSESSISSQWVEQEVETALAKERREKRLVLFPIRLDDAVLREKAGWASYLKNTRHVGDFCRWKHAGAYQSAFARLLRDLRVQNAVGE